MKVLFLRKGLGGWREEFEKLQLLPLGDSAGEYRCQEIARLRDRDVNVGFKVRGGQRVRAHSNPRQKSEACC